MAENIPVLSGHLVQFIVWQQLQNFSGVEQTISGVDYLLIFHIEIQNNQGNCFVDTLQSSWTFFYYN